MIRQSKQFASNCFWFSTIISKQSHLEGICEALKDANAVEIQIIPMAQGTKTSRIVAWTFMNQMQQKKWMETRWNVL